MALETINIGNYVNDGTGDDLRTAFTKINANFEELDLLGGQNNTISNVGTGIGLYKEKIGVDLKLRTLKSGAGIVIALSNPNEITITNDRYSFNTIEADSGNITATDSITSLSIVGGTNVTTSLISNVLTINTTQYDFSLDPNPTLGANLNLNGNSIIGIGNININGDVTANNFNGAVTGNVTGNLTGLVYGIDIRDIESTVNVFDFGGIIFQASNPIEYMLLSTYIDMGTFVSPNAIGIDGGTIV
jgi:hypothetical protein